MNSEKSIGNRLQKLRGNNIRKDMCEKIGMNRDTMYQHEWDITKPSFNMLLKYAKYYGMTLSKLLEGVEE